MVSVPDWMKEPTGIMKMSCTLNTLLIVIIARVGFPDKSPPSGWSTDHEESFTLAISEHGYGVSQRWLTITAACGFAIILLNWVATNLHGDGDKLPAHSEFRLMVIGAALFISSGVQSVQLHWGNENTEAMGLALGGLCIGNGATMATASIFHFKQFMKK